MIRRGIQVIPIILVLGFSLFNAHITTGQIGTGEVVASAGASTTTDAVCDTVRYLMQENITPHDMGSNGAAIQSGAQQSSTWIGAHYQDTWSFNVTLPRNPGGFPVSDILQIHIDRMANGMGLEFAVFAGMNRIADENGNNAYRPVIPAETYIFPLNVDGIHTIVFRRQNPANVVSGNYAFTAEFSGSDQITPASLRDNTTNRTLPTTPIIHRGRQITTVNETQIFTHPGVISSAATHDGAAAQVRLGPGERNWGVYVRSWADQISLLGGDLAVRGSAGARSRIFYLQDYGYQINLLDGDLGNITDSNGTRWRLNWQMLDGVWIMADCAGFKTTTGETFVGRIDPNQRDVTFLGSADEFTIRLLHPTESGTSARQLVMDWSGIQPQAEIRLDQGIFDIPQIGDRQLELEASSITMRRRATIEPQPENIPLEIELIDRAATVVLDWRNLHRFALIGDEIRLEFLDSDREPTVRRGSDLERFEALRDVIYIGYNEPFQGILGEQRLLLPESEGFIEIVTPPGMPIFDGRALPGDTRYMPRALNNTGAECYPINTIQSQVNCPPNGHFNPANGNLWYAVTDHMAFGQLVDLALTRSYNSAHARVQGSFGYGWSSAFPLDYDVEFNEATNSRLINQISAGNYPVSLDLIWAPRGVVTFTTASGSKHTFVASTNRFNGGTMTALTMPGWELSRRDIRDPRWTLRQDGGLTYEFDRAGRLVSYGYPLSGRVITIDYAGDLFNGLAGLGERPIIITDAANLRRLELYYNENHRIGRSVMRDVSQIDNLDQIDLESCDLDESCYETLYTYEDGYLVGVRYANGNQATYAYDSQGRLSFHDDPRAPISPVMTYAYGEDGSTSATIITDDGSEIDWQRLDAPREDPAARTRSVTVIDHINNRRTYTYAWTEGALKSAGGSFTLLSETSPLSQITLFEAEPIRYTWQNGLLERVQARLIRDGVGRNSVIFEYAGGTRISRIRSGYPGFTATYIPVEGFADDLLPQSLTFADATTINVTYDALGQIDTLTDRYGAVYEYTWDFLRRLTSLTNVSEGTATDYVYNQLGLVTSVTQRRLDDPTEQHTTVNYTYDGLGRLTQVEDELTGTYTIHYRPARLNSDLTYMQTVVSDPTGTVTTSIMDSAGQLQERRIEHFETGAILERTTYTYDYLRRPHEETQWLSPLEGDDFETARPLTTTFNYRTVPVLSLQPGDGSAANRVINGHEVSITDAYGRIERYTYDGLDRIRQVVYPSGRLTRFDYDVTDTSGFVNGIRITQRDIQGNRLYNTTEYVFDLRWQLRSVIRNADEAVDDPGEVWEFFFEGETTRMQALRARQAGIAELGWSNYEDGRPTRIEYFPTTLSLNSGASLPSSTLNAEYDFMGRPLMLRDGQGHSYNVNYCPLAGGGQKITYALPDSESDDCDSRFIQAIAFDARERIIRIEDTNGTRDYIYTVIPGGWHVEVTFRQAQEITARWLLIYDGTGNLVQWVDESGFEHNYHYDTLHRLRRVEVIDPSGALQPEASYTFKYNAAHLVTEALDDLRRGTLYDYNALGRLTVKQDARTANATIYGYNSEGMLSSVISPLGNTTTYQYNNPHRPTQLTGIIEPTGSIVEFQWNSTGNQLSYINARDNVTTYTFDSFGALWRIDDALGRSHELHYDSAGNLTAWRQSQPQEGNPARHMVLSRPSPYRLNISQMRDSISWARDFLMLPNGQLSSILPYLSGDSGGSLNFSYDPLGRLTGATASQHQWTLDYASGQPLLTFVDSNEIEHHLRFDALNRLASEDIGEESTTYTYERVRSADINLIVEGDEIQVYTFASGDVSSRPRSVVLSAPGRRISYIYNAEGLLSEIVTETCIAPTPLETFDPYRPDDCIRTNADTVWRTSERIVYDTQGRPVRYIDEEQNIETFAYDDAGNLIVYQNINGKTFDYTYDALNRLESIIGPTGIRVLLRYDGLDRVTGICRARAEDPVSYENCVLSGGELETYTYDPLGRLQTQGFPAEGGNATTSYFYAAGNQGLLSGWGSGENAGVSMQRSDDGLGILETIVTGSAVYNLEYDGLYRLTDAGDITYTYDETGRLQSVTARDHRLVYTYNSGNNGYSIHDEATGDMIAFNIDERGLLASIESGANFDYFLNPDREILVVQINRGDGELIEMQINRRGETLNVAYTESNLFVDYVLDPVGQVSRQSVIGLPGYFEADAGGYIVVIGYDNDDRPLTMRVNDRDTGELLYLLGFTYNALGQRVTETRQYGNGSQITTSYTYTASNQLVRSNQTIQRATRGSAPSIIASLNYLYLYDTAGNLTKIIADDTEPQTCVTYEYDSANLLTVVRQGDNLQRYAYDVYNRLIDAGDNHLIYHGDTNILLGSQTDGSDAIRYHGQPTHTVGLFQLQQDDLVWLLNDGHQGLLATINTEGENSGPVWLFDPLGRYLQLDITFDTSEPIDPCAELAPLPEALQEISPLQALQPGMIWDAITNLYFLDGRAYNPELGRFLQRDPLGPDVFGNIYSYPSRQTVPPVRTTSTYAEGLQRLHGAMDEIESTRRLTAGDIMAAHLPTYEPHIVEPLLPLLADIAAQSQQQLANTLDLPVWLGEAYNLPGPYLDETGALRMVRDNAPAQGGKGQPTISSGDAVNLSRSWLPQNTSSLGYLQQLNHLAMPPERFLIFYESWSWQPDLPSISQIWQLAAPRPSLTSTPAAISEWLPQRSYSPVSGAMILDAIDLLVEIPNRAGIDWLETALEVALPGVPELPPASSQEWLENWFSYDTFQIADILASRWPDLPQVSIPVYRSGVNYNWSIQR